MKRYIEGVLFTGLAGMDERRVMMRLNRGDAKSLLFDVFVTAIRELSIVERESEPTGESIRVSATEPYPTTRPVLTAKKTVFNLVPCDSSLEERFVRWLDDVASDILAFAKNEPAVHFEIPYVSAGGRRSLLPTGLPDPDATGDVRRRDKRLGDPRGSSQGPAHSPLVPGRHVADRPGVALRQGQRVAV